MTWTSLRGHKGTVKMADVHWDLKDSNPKTILFYSILFYTLQHSRYFRYNPINKRDFSSK